MDNGKLLIPISFYLIAMSIYENFAVSENTTWTIFYMVCVYSSWLLLLLLMPKKRTRIIAYRVLQVALFSKIVIEISKLGMAYDDYITSINDFTAMIIPSSIMIAGLTYFILKK